MPESQTQFDTQLTDFVNQFNTYNQNVTALCTAAVAYVNAHQAGQADLTTEGQAVTTAAQAIQTSSANVTAALAALNPTPPPQPPPPPPPPAPGP